MGDIADMMLDGTLDEQTGEYLSDAVGYPRTKVKGHYNTIKHKETPSEKKIRSIRKEIAIDVKNGTSVEDARKNANLKYGKGWRSRGLCVNDKNQWSNDDLREFV